MAEAPESPPNSDPVETKVPTGPGFSITFLYYFSGSVLAATLLASKSSIYGLGATVPGQLPLIVGLLGGFLGGFFNHTMTLEIPIPSRKAFLQLLETTLEPMGYELAEEVDGIKIYRRPALRQLFSGKVYVEVQDKRAILSSRAVHIRALRKQLLQKKSS